MSNRSAVPPSAVAALGLVGGFLAARRTGRRDLGGALFAAADPWSAGVVRCCAKYRSDSSGLSEGRPAGGERVVCRARSRLAGHGVLVASAGWVRRVMSGIALAGDVGDLGWNADPGGGAHDIVRSGAGPRQLALEGGRAAVSGPGVAGDTQAQADEEVVDHFIGAWPWHFRFAGAQVRHAVQQ